MFLAVPCPGLQSPPPLEQFLEKAASALESSRPGEAEKLARQGLEHYPRSAPLLHSLGLALGLQGRVLQAEEAYREALGINPGYLEVLLALAELYQVQGRFAEAAARYEEALSRAAGRTSLYLDIAAARAGNGELNSALDWIGKYLADQPNAPQAHFLRGQVLLEQQKFSDSEQSLARAIDLGLSNRAAGWSRLGVALMKQGKFQAAVSSFERSLKERPDDPLTWFQLGGTRLQLGLSDGAIEAFREATTLDPGMDMAHFSLGVAYFDLGDFTRAKESLQNAARKSPQNPQYLFALGRVCRRLDQKEEAAEHFRRALDLNPGNRAPRMQYATLLRELKRPSDAADQFEALSKEDPSNIDILYPMGMAQWSAARKPASKETLARCAGTDREGFLQRLFHDLATGSDVDAGTAGEILKTLGMNLSPVESNYRAGVAHMGLEQYARGEASFLAALEHKKDALEVRYQLGIAQRLLEKYPEALASFQICEAAGFRLAGAALNRGEVYLRQMRLPEAEREARLSLQREPSLAPARLLLVRVLLEKEQDAAALKELDAALSQNPSLEDVYRLKARIYRRQGKPGLADEQIAVAERLRRQRLVMREQQRPR